MASTDQTERLDRVFALLTERGGEQYGGESVSQLQHALQAAALAEISGAEPELIVAALFHDIGHLLEDDFETAAAMGKDRYHEQLSAGYLSGVFGPDVVEPIRMHVPAKRYLCAVDPDYFGRLSPASVRSLELQGGKFDGVEAKAFISQPFAAGAVKVRRWDDEAKDVAATTPDLDHFRAYAQAVRLVL